jgi:hypothetical protein
MEWTALPAQAQEIYSIPVSPLTYILSLGAALSFFLSDKGVLAASHQPTDLTALLRAAQTNPANSTAQFTLIAGLLRLTDLGRANEPAAFLHAQGWLTSPAAQSCQISDLQAKFN